MRRGGPARLCVALVVLTPERPPDDQVSARLAVMALRASLPELPIDGPQWLVDEARTPMSAEQVADVLAARAKPLLCEASWDGHVVRVRTSVMTDRQAVLVHRQRELMSFDSISQFVTNRYASAGKPVDIEVRSAWDSLTVPLEMLRDWFLDYRVEYSASYVHAPDAAANAAGVTALMLLGSARGMQLDVEIEPDGTIRLD